MWRERDRDRPEERMREGQTEGKGAGHQSIAQTHIGVPVDKINGSV